jgi:hypothetical protein
MGKPAQPLRLWVKILRQKVAYQTIAQQTQRFTEIGRQPFAERLLAERQFDPVFGQKSNNTINRCNLSAKGCLPEVCLIFLRNTRIMKLEK